MKKTLKWNLAQKVELSWWQQYLKGKDVDAYHHWKKNYWQGILEKTRQFAAPMQGMHVLDAGCGPAGMFMVLEDCKVDAVDPLLDKYAAELPHFKKEMYPGVRFFNAPIEAFSADTSYDIIFCMNAINHVSDIQGSYTHLVSLLKPGGKLVVSIDAHNYRFFKHLFRMIPGDVLHPHQYDLKEYAGFLTDRGCRILHSVRLKHEFFFDHYLQVAEKI